MRLRYCFYLVFIFCLACSNKTKSDFANCKSGVPKPIFKVDSKEILKESFELKEDHAEETIELLDHSTVMLIHSGCEKPVQEFRFAIPQDLRNASDNAWKILAVNQFDKLSLLHPSLKSFSEWATIIKDNVDKFKLSEPLEVATGIQITIDKVLADQNNLLIVRLEQH
jgi:hypothetical protein